MGASDKKFTETDKYRVTPDEMSQLRKEAEEFVKSRKAGGRPISPLDVEAKWSVTAVDDKAAGAVKYSVEDHKNQIKREMATVMNRVMDDNGKLNKASPIYKQLEQIESGRGPASQRIGLALEHNKGNISYSEDLTAIQERLKAAQERGPKQGWSAARDVVAKAEKAAEKAMPAVTETLAKYGGKAVEAITENGGKAVKFAAKHAGDVADLAERNKAVKAVASIAGAAVTMATAAGSASAAEINGAPKKETFAEKSWRVAKVGLDDLLPGSKDLIEGRNMCKNAFSVASQVTGNAAGAVIGAPVGVVVGGVAGLGTSTVATPVVGAVVGVATTTVVTSAVYDGVSSGVQNVGKKLSGMVCGGP